jgi:hypothetical protein
VPPMLAPPRARPACAARSQPLPRRPELFTGAHRSGATKVTKNCGVHRDHEHERAEGLRRDAGWIARVAGQAAAGRQAHLSSPLFSHLHHTRTAVVYNPDQPACLQSRPFPRRIGRRALGSHGEERISACCAFSSCPGPLARMQSFFQGASHVCRPQNWPGAVK